MEVNDKGKKQARREALTIQGSCAKMAVVILLHVCNMTFVGALHLFNTAARPPGSFVSLIFSGERKT